MPEPSVEDIIKRTVISAGGRPPHGVSAAWFEIGATSWAAGRRTVECTAVRYGPNGNLLPVTG